MLSVNFTVVLRDIGKQLHNVSLLAREKNLYAKVNH